MSLFRDSFTVGSNTDLDSHGPDLGASWSLLWQTGATSKATAFSASGTLLPANTVADSGFIYTANATYNGPDYSVSAKIVAGFTGTNRGYLLVRVQDSANMYALRFTTGATVTRMYSNIAGVWTGLGSFIADPAIGSVVTLRVVGSTLTYYYDGVLQDTQTDTNITAAGKAGIAQGGGTNLAASTDDILNTSELDNFIVNVAPYPAFNRGTRPHPFSPGLAR